MNLIINFNSFNFVSFQMTHYLFTDPACLGLYHRPTSGDVDYPFNDPACLGPDHVTASGDVDDIACMIYMSQKLRDKLVIVICDDDDDQNRFHSKKDLFIKLRAIYQIAGVLPESSLNSTSDNHRVMHIATSPPLTFEKQFPLRSTIHIHSPINSNTVDFLLYNISSIETVHRQGFDSSTNFLHSPASIDHFPNIWY